MVELTTQCPHCGTRFQASLEQLQLRKGYIRCLHCAHIFDGYEAVVAGDAVASAPVAPAASTPAPAEAQRPPATPSVLRRRGEFTISGAEPAAPVRSEPVVADSAGRQDDAAPSLVLPPSPHARREREYPEAGQRWGAFVRMLWLLLIILGLAAMVAQAAFVFRVQLAGQFPATRPLLERLCEPLGCQVAYARHPELIVITQSSLQRSKVVAAETDAKAQEEPATGAATTGGTAEETTAYVLSFTLRNRHGGAQEWPVVVLELKDAAGATVARRNLPSTTYLPTDAHGQPFPASSERHVRLPLEIRGLTLNGYQLTTFFP